MGQIVMPADLAEVINLHREMFGGYRMEATDDPPAEPAAEATTPAETPPATGEEQLGDAGKKALAAERKAAREAQRQLAEAQARLQEIEDADKSELQKATDAAAKAQQEAEEARQELARERIARKHTLSDEDMELLAGDEEQMERLAARIAQASPPADPDPDPAAPKAPPVPGIERTPGTRNIPLVDQIAAAEKAGDKSLVASLKAMQLTAAASQASS